jgi:hypothetical protein
MLDRYVCHFFVRREEGDMDETKIKIILAAILAVATLVSVAALLSAVNKADHGTTEVPSNGASTKN